MTRFGKSDWYLIPTGVFVLVLLATDWRRAPPLIRFAWAEIGALVGYFFFAVAFAGILDRPHQVDNWAVAPGALRSRRRPRLPPGLFRVRPYELPVRPCDDGCRGDRRHRVDVAPLGCSDGDPRRRCRGEPGDGRRALSERCDRRALHRGGLRLGFGFLARRQGRRASASTGGGGMVQGLPRPGGSSPARVGPAPCSRRSPLPLSAAFTPPRRRLP